MLRDRTLQSVCALKVLTCIYTVQYLFSTKTPLQRSLAGTYCDLGIPLFCQVSIRHICSVTSHHIQIPFFLKSLNMYLHCTLCILSTNTPLQRSLAGTYCDLGIPLFCQVSIRHICSVTSHHIQIPFFLKSLNMYLHCTLCILSTNTPLQRSLAGTYCDLGIPLFCPVSVRHTCSVTSHHIQIPFFLLNRLN